LQERESFYIARQRPDVDYRHWHKGEQMRYETVDAGTDIYVLDRSIQENLSRRPKILMEVVCFHESGACMTVGQNRECVFDS